ncbi:MAG: hypothetical protein EBR30_06525 [Cytophagia bacterium]|nr:hypothetical protein [Cytophagia bacterium]
MLCPCAKDRGHVSFKIFKKMKKFKYVMVFVFGLLVMSCTEEVITPSGEEDDPITIPPPPPPPKPPVIGG